MMSDNELIEQTNKIIKEFVGDSAVLERALGVLLIGRHVGWKPLYIMHSQSVIKKYEKLLGVSFKEVMPEVGSLANKSLGWKLSLKVSNFWKAVKGEIKGIKTSKLTLM